MSASFQRKCISFSDLPLPVVPILAFDAEVREILQSIWCLAQEDPTAYPLLKDELILGRMSDLSTYKALASQIQKLQASSQHVRFRSMISYTLDILDEIWHIACAHPSALAQHYPGSRAVTRGHVHRNPLYERHQRLAWSIWRLQKAGMCRLSRSDACPIEKLPTELLWMIFGNLRHITPRYEYGCRDLWNRSAHLSMRLVCRCWHDTISEMPALWTDMVLDFGSAMTKLALPLTRNLSLNFEVHAKIGWTPSHSLVLEHMSRISTMKVRSYSWEVFQRLLPLLQTSSAPRLESMCLIPYVRFEGKRSILLSTDLLQGKMPNGLHTVHLLGCKIHLPNPLFSPMLNRLELVRCDVWADMDSLIGTLSRLPILEVFRWHMGLDTLSTFHSLVRFPDAMFFPPRREPAILSRLCILDVEGPVVCTGSLMEHLLIPSLCQVTFSDDHTLTGVQRHDHCVREKIIRSLEPLRNHLLQAFTTRSTAGCDLVRFEEPPEVSSHRGAFCIKFYIQSDSQSSCSVAFHVADQNPGSIDADTISFLLHSILSWPAMRYTRSFETNHEILTSPELWATVFACLPQLTKLHVEHGSSMCDVSGAILGLVQALTDGSHLLPDLQHVHLEYMSYPPSHQRRLAEAAQKRFAAGRPALFLYLERCLDYQGAGELEDFVRNHGGGAFYVDPRSS